MASISSHSNSEEEAYEGRIRYKLSQKEFEKHKLDLISKQQYAVVRDESWSELENCSEVQSPTHQGIARRVFKNHDIASARASHSSAIARVRIHQQLKEIKKV